MDLHIDHLDCRYQIPTSAADGPVIQQRLDRIAMDRIVQVWEGRADPEASDDEPIYFVAYVEVNLILDTSIEDDRALAETWSCELHKGVADALRYGGPTVVVFTNRRAFLASFLGDLLRGGAWDKWYYREFAPLGSMSTAEAASSVLIAESDTGRDVLIELTRRGDLDLLLANLSDREIVRVVDRCLLPASQRFVLPNTYARWADALRRLVSTRPYGFSHDVPRDLVRLYLTMMVEESGLGPDVNLARFISELLQLRNTIIGLKDGRGFLKLVTSEAWDRVLAEIGEASQRRFIGELARDLGGQQLTALLRELHAESPETPTQRISTRYGGLFLLTPAAIEMGLYGFLRDCPYPDPAGASKSSLLLFRIGLQCLGGKNAPQAAQDAGLILFAGLTEAPSKSYLDRYAETLTGDMHERFHSLFRRQQASAINWRPNRSSTGDDVEDRSEWFSPSPEAEYKEWDQALQPVSDTLIHLFASRLGAFRESSPAYLSRNFLECHADVEVNEDRIAVRFLTCPLQMVLRMAGFDHVPALLWLGNRKLEFYFH